jgi:uncharacterized protein YcfL
MKKLLSIILLAIVFTSCDSSKPILQGKKHQLVLGNPRVKAQKERKAENKVRQADIAHK